MNVIFAFREFEQQRELREKGLQTTSDQGTHDGSTDSKESSPDKNVNNHINKVLLSLITSVLYIYYMYSSYPFPAYLLESCIFVI